MLGADVENLWGQQGLLTLSATGKLYTNHLDGAGPAQRPLYGSFQPLIVPTALKRICADHTPLPSDICARANYLLNILNLPWLADCEAPNRDGWLEVERSGRGFLMW